MNSPQDQWLDHLQSATHYNQWIFSRIAPHLKGRTLEVGCGTGNFTTLIAQCCSQLVAVDLNADYVAQTQARLSHCKHINVMTADATKMDASETFDTIILLDVLEHIENDVDLLLRLRRQLAPGGTLLLKVPAIAPLYNSLDAAVGHHRRYTPETLRQTILSAKDNNISFAEPAIDYFNAIGIVGWWLNGSILKRTAPPGQQVGLFDRCVPLFQAAENWLHPPTGLSLFAAATLPTPSALLNIPA